MKATVEVHEKNVVFAFRSNIFSVYIPVDRKTMSVLCTMIQEKVSGEVYVENEEGYVAIVVSGTEDETEQIGFKLTSWEDTVLWADASRKEVVKTLIAEIRKRID